MNPVLLVVLFVVSAVLGYVIIRNVPALLHTPLMSGMNALSGVTVLGAIIAAFEAKGTLAIILALAAWYLLIGFSLSRFVTASYTNGQFDKFINPRIEGAQVNRGLSEEEDWDEEDETEEEREIKPWENGYTSQDQ